MPELLVPNTSSAPYSRVLVPRSIGEERIFAYSRVIRTCCVAEHCKRSSSRVTQTCSVFDERVRPCSRVVAITARTSGGSVSAYLTAQPAGDSSLTTSGGSVTVYLADDIAVDLDARTSGGSARTDFDVLAHGDEDHSRHRIAGSLNGGGPELYLRTSGGNIRVLRQ